MPLAKINFQGVKTEFEPVPEGLYESELVDYKVTATKGGKNPGTPMANLQFKIVEEGEFTNRRLFRPCVFSQESLWVFKRTMNALGAEVDWESEEGVEAEDIMRAVIGNRCVLKVSIRTYEVDGVEKQQNQVDDAAPLDTGNTADVTEAVGARGRRR